MRSYKQIADRRRTATTRVLVLITFDEHDHVYGALIAPGVTRRLIARDQRL